MREIKVCQLISKKAKLSKAKTGNDGGILEEVKRVIRHFARMLTLQKIKITRVVSYHKAESRESFSKNVWVLNLYFRGDFVKNEYTSIKLER